jgi:methanogenic corrinoid protein MtbC1
MARSRDLAQLLSEFDEDAALATVTERLASGEDPLALVAECRRGMQIVGERYEAGVYYISALIMAGEVLREILEILGPRITGDAGPNASATILMCTVQGDIHDVGKDIAATLLQAHGFEVVDLGVDVAPSRVADEVESRGPDAVGLSGLLAEAFESMKRTIEAIRERTSGWTRPVPVVLGGSPINQTVCDYAGADGWCNDAIAGVGVVRDLLAAAKVSGTGSDAST